MQVRRRPPGWFDQLPIRAIGQKRPTSSPGRQLEFSEQLDFATQYQIGSLMGAGSTGKWIERAGQPPIALRCEPLKDGNEAGSSIAEIISLPPAGRTPSTTSRPNDPSSLTEETENVQA
jgi:hypothetical protein